MASINLGKSRLQASTFVIFLFFVIVSLMAVYSEIFQTRKPDIDLTQIYTNPFSEAFLNTANKIEIKNRLGSFTLQKNKLQDNIEKWFLTKPRNLEANKNNVLKILKDLQSFDIRKIYEMDKINISNFSLNQPLVEMKLSSDINSLQVNIGLINPVNNSAYISFPHINKIFQITNFNYHLESIVMSNLIDASVFDFELSHIELLEIYTDNTKTPFFKITKSGEYWLDKKSNQLDPDKVQTLLTSILALKTLIILDERSEKTEKLIKRYTQYPLYRVRYKNLGKFNEVIVTNILNKTADLKVERKKHFIIHNPTKKHPFILRKEFLKIFNQRESKLRL